MPHISRKLPASSPRLLPAPTLLHTHKPHLVSSHLITCPSQEPVRIVASGTSNPEQHLIQHATSQAQVAKKSQSEMAFATMNGHQQQQQQQQQQHVEYLLQKPRRILPLSPKAISQIHSSKHITSLKGVIFSLLENSLDAGANKVDISVDWRRGNCSVEDNGIGIPALEFEESGGLGNMYCTSKRNAEGKTHGTAGTFLAELGNMSLLTITSRSQGGSGNGESMVSFHQGQILARQLNAGEERMAFANLHRRHGTSVTVRDLFGNIPVRVKQRALAAEMGNDEEKAWQELKRGVVALLLAWPKPCAVKVRDTNTETRKLNLTSGILSALTERALTGRSSEFVKHDIRDGMPTIFQAGLAPMDSRTKWIPLSASTSLLNLRGIICLDPAPTKQCQFLAIGITPCSSNEFYHAVNKVLENSCFGVVEESGRGKRNVMGEKVGKTGLDRHAMYFMQVSFKEQTTVRDTNMNEATMQSLTPVLEAAVHAWLESNNFRPRKRRRRRKNQDQGSPASARYSGATQTVSLRQLSSISPQHRGPVSSVSTRDESEANPAHLEQKPQTSNARRRQRIVDLSTEQLIVQSPFLDHLDETGDWHTLSRARSGLSRGLPSRTSTSKEDRCCHPEDTRSLHTGDEATYATSTYLTKRLFAPLILAGELNSNAGSRCKSGSHTTAAALSSDNFGAINDEDLLAAVQESELDQVDSVVVDDNITTWTDPISKQVFQVNSRTGVVLPVAEHTSRATSSHSGPRHRAAIDTAVSSAGTPISLARRSALARTRPETATGGKDRWLPGFLKEWKNPIFTKKKEDPIPTASISGPGLIEQIEEDRRCCPDDKYHQAFAKHGAKIGGTGGTKLSKAALKYAEVIGQVDRKFILVKMPFPAENNEKPEHARIEKGSTLVLIDQHAASERIILEDLLAGMIVAPPTPTPDSESILKKSSLVHSTTRSKTLSLEISSREHGLFMRHTSHFAHWGIKYTLPSPTFASSLEGSHNHLLIITHLPAVIAERCSNFPALAIELIRTEIWEIEDGMRKPSILVRGACDQAKDGGWVNLLPQMPSKLREMIHSRACRSAIMFNDVLSKEDCEALVKGLGSCRFPFVCAHGRRGVVPVMDLRDANEMGRRIDDCGSEGIGVGDGLRQESGRSIDLRELIRFMGNDTDGRHNETTVDQDEDMVELSLHKFD